MDVFKFKAKPPKKFIAYTKDEDGSNLPSNFQNEPIKWVLCENITTSNVDIPNNRLEEIEKNGFCIIDITIDISERTENIPLQNNNPLKFIDKKKRK